MDCLRGLPREAFDPRSIAAAPVDPEAPRRLLLVTNSGQEEGDRCANDVRSEIGRL